MPHNRPKRLLRSFYDRPTLDVCRDTLGKYLVYETPSTKLAGRVVEVEAYIGESDPACHAAPGPTKRNIYLYGKPGLAYVYLIYGFHFCLNFVTEREGFPAAVLVRAAEPVEGIAEMEDRTPTKLPVSKLVSGPGRLCRAFGLTLKQNGWDIADRNAKLYLEDRGEGKVSVGHSRRIGISKGAEKLWRLFDLESDAVSKLPTPRITSGKVLSRKK